MAIDPGLYKKYTGRTPGDAMIRMGESLAQDAKKERGGDTSTLGAVVRGRKILRIIIAIGVLIAVIAVLAGGKLF
jgi:hypothetical protein